MTMILQNKSSPLSRALRAAAVAVPLMLGSHMQAHAAAQWCTGTLNQLFIVDDGSVLVWASWVGNYIQVCNVNQPLGAVSTTTCMNWVQLMRSAIQRQTQTTILSNDAPACNAMPGYGSAPVPKYIMMIN